MKSRWNQEEAARCSGDLGLRIYSARLLGCEPALALHGGGNCSVKVVEPGVFGEREDMLYVKGSGADLATIQESGFAPLRLAPVRRLAQLDRLSDAQMVDALASHRTRAGAPAPSVEALLHAVIPHKYVDHTHADAVLALTDTSRPREHVAAAFGGAVIVVPYVMPGFELARHVARVFPRQFSARTLGMVLLRHGLFTFGATARESYERTIRLVTAAERYLRRRGAWRLPRPRPHRPAAARPLPASLAALRREISAAAGFPLLLRAVRTPAALAFARRKDVARIAGRGPATPDHVLRTKRVPMLGRDVAAFARAYERYFRRHAAAAARPLAMLDPAPRVVLDPELGLCAAGRSARDAAAAAEIYLHTMEVILRATALGGYRPLRERDIFAVEYWDLEQAKLRRAGPPPLFAGEVALVTGAASGIGRACAGSFLDRGAAVVGLDANPAVATMLQRADYLGLRADITDGAALRRALERAVLEFGGLDMLILNAGVFPATARIESVDESAWRRALEVNATGNLALLRSCHPLLRLSPRGGRVVVIGTRNVAAPGPGAAAYSASKAALTQLARVAALEWARDGIRVNTIHPDAVFDTGLWTRRLLAERARQYGMSIEAYKRRNLLGVEVRSRDVAELAAEMCGPLFARTTGAQVPVDGGSERVV